MGYSPISTLRNGYIPPPLNEIINLSPLDVGVDVDIKNK